MFTTTAHSQLGEKYEAEPLKRRHTTVYIRENGNWLWFVQHANVVGIVGASPARRKSGIESHASYVGPPISPW